MKQYLTPSIEDLRLDYVLIQAWKKTAAYLRSHSWYADTLELDYESLRLPHFVKEIQERLREPENWKPKPILLVPAPKSQRWSYSDGEWKPHRREKVAKKIRPLAHVDIQDQVVATAIMMCLADRVENELGDPRLSIQHADTRKKVLAYGHRLICDKNDDGNLRHRWGNSMIYRQYYQDYRTFLERPKLVANALSKYTEFEDQTVEDYEIAIVQTDISKFYDNVRPEFLWEKLYKFMNSPEEQEFFNLTSHVFDWRWIKADEDRITKLAKEQGSVNFDLVSLPQGLVTAGFFANIVLSDFDKALRETIGKELHETGMFLEDACYYVDDLRLVLRVPKGLLEDEVGKEVIGWIQKLLNEYADGLKISAEKTNVTVEGRDKKFLIKQSSEADRIQHQVSGVFDMQHGTEIIAAIEGFFSTQQRYSIDSNNDKKIESGLLMGVPDMKDETAARFAAGKFRRTFRSLRPLLSDEIQYEDDTFDDETDTYYDYERTVLRRQLLLTKQQLDERAKLFSALLIEEWIKNPGNVRLFRIALDIYPDKEFLQVVLNVLCDAWKKTTRSIPIREIKLYCLAELFRAGATETGIVKEDECLPGSLSIEEYHDVLIEEAKQIVNEYFAARFSKTRFPWYFMQQVFLYLSSRNNFPESIATNKSASRLLSKHFHFAKYLSGKKSGNIQQQAIFLAIAKTGFGIEGFSFLEGRSQVSAKFLREVHGISPKLANELWKNYLGNAPRKAYVEAQRLGLVASPTEDPNILARVAADVHNPFMKEENLLEFAKWLFENRDELIKSITPWNISCIYENSPDDEFGKVNEKKFKFQKSSVKMTGLFEPCNWCETEEERQKYQIGLLLRFAILGTTGFYGNYSTSNPASKRLRYSKPVSHWEQQRYSTVQNRKALGPPWLPISSFIEDILFELLKWPGTGILAEPHTIEELETKIDNRLQELKRKRGMASDITFLEQRAPWLPNMPEMAFQRPLRIGIIQTIIPDSKDYKDNYDEPDLSKAAVLRSKQKRHLASIMQGVSQMLQIRETHIYKNKDNDKSYENRNDGGIVDLLIFPELSIHPEDIDTLILPFSRSYKCMMLFGQVYHKKDNRPKSPLINSCLWMIPEATKTKGLEIRRIEQGKKNLMELEEQLVPKPEGFRPVQWLIEYEWSKDKSQRPLVLSASICYDATDLSIATDLRSRSDLYIICALNQDVGTFDRMSESLHYHMYQGVIVVNNGKYGGSSLFMPFKDTFNRQVVHLHGQYQASISFVEISPEKLINRSEEAYAPKGYPQGNWKTPPAGWKGRR